MVGIWDLFAVGRNERWRWRGSKFHPILLIFAPSCQNVIEKYLNLDIKHTLCARK